MTEIWKPNQLSPISFVMKTINGAIRMPMKDAPPTVAVFRLFSIFQASILAAGMHIKRSRVNINKPAISDVDVAPSNIISIKTANSVATALKKPYQVRFQPLQ